MPSSSSREISASRPPTREAALSATPGRTRSSGWPEGIASASSFSASIWSCSCSARSALSDRRARRAAGSRSVIVASLYKPAARGPDSLAGGCASPCRAAPASRSLPARPGRDPDRECRAFAQLARHVDGAPDPLHHHLRQGKPETRATKLAHLGLPGPEEAAEDARQRLGRYADAVVGDLYLDLLAGVTGPYVDPSALGRVL